jgi:glycopeptide antibiotics resistance protein
MKHINDLQEQEVEYQKLRFPWKLYHLLDEANFLDFHEANHLKYTGANARIVVYIICLIFVTLLLSM